MKWKEEWVLLVIAATLIPVPVNASESTHVPVVCGISFRGPNRQQDLQGLSDLPVSLQELVNRHIGDRVGCEYSSAIAFEQGQLKNLDAPSSSEQVRDKLARRLYNLIYQFRLSPGQNVSACILLEPNGNLVQPLSLPAWAHGAAQPRVVTLAEARAVASKQGIPESTEVKLRYFPDTDTLEWLFSITTDERSGIVLGKTLHVPVENSAFIHWSEWNAIR
jgi:hypothetical protein